MAPNNTNGARRAFQQDARAWSVFTDTNYTSALRQISSPLAQGLIGPRVSARRLISVLNDHELIGAHGGAPRLSERGIRSDSPWNFNGKTDYIELALVTDTLRMFTPTSGSDTPEVGSYSLKHTVEQFLSPHVSYVSNGRLIWAAAALGLPITDPDGAGPNLLIGVSDREHDYLRRMVGSGQTRPQANHYRPTGYEYLRTALPQAAAGDLIAKRWVRPEMVAEPAPFHDWLIQQIDRDDIVGDLAGDYLAGVRESGHRVARTADELLAIFHEISHSTGAYEAVVTSIAEWMRTEPAPAPIRTEPIDGAAHDHGGWGAGAGTVERYEFMCPCGDGRIIEEHDNIPGFREHDVWIDCDKCREEWRFVEGRSVRGWGLEPVVANVA
ncbi:hypothetical protein BCF74_11675 [Knoellia remsis]|uniref:Uncharacterized protein n=1 Tax=Knoellia remsis TaxID=407159 RepID=A0A2T0UGS1_9MICO|nr:hypothetical protein [Knoellia remsis]PRY57153.1 hypothetical protein BCF74_11675 [Knoellia remsis]